MIRSSKLILKFANSGKKEELEFFLSEYRSVVRRFVDMLWNEKRVPCLLPKIFTSKINTWLTARMVQCAGKQASSIVRGTRKKYEQRLFMLKKLKKDGKDVALLKKCTTSISKPKLGNIPAELDERFIKISEGKNTMFDMWLMVGCIGDRIKLVLPLKKHSHFNKIATQGKMLKGLRIRERDVTFMFEVEKKKKTEGKILGLDVGVSSCVATSDGVLTQKDNHGHSLSSIMQTLSKRKKGSKGFKKATLHRKNFINWSVNQLNLSNVKELRCEVIKNLRRGQKTSRFLSHWAYRDIFSKLERFCEEQGVLVRKVNPAYTSQTCPKCKSLGKRRREKFECVCGYTNHADLNAALNLASGEFTVPRENVGRNNLLQST